MTHITEKEIEQLAIKTLQHLGYLHSHGATITSDTPTAQRASYHEVILTQHLAQAIASLNPDIPYDAQEDALKQVVRLGSSDLLTDNETFHKMLTDGVSVTYQQEGNPRGNRVKLIDFSKVDNNTFHIIDQLTIKGQHTSKRLDLILFVNGLPLVVMELKNPINQQATLHHAYNQIQTYKTTLPSLFTYNAFCVISDGTDARAGTLSANFTRFMAWKTADGKTQASKHTPQLSTLIQGMLNKNTLLELIRHFIVFEKTKTQDPHTNTTTTQVLKKIAAYHQYYAVKKAVTHTLQARQQTGNKKGGVVWHTQGSGKSLSMLFYAGKIILSLDNPTILVITDRNDLDEQLFSTFSASSHLLRQTPKKAKNRTALKQLLSVASGGVVFSTIQKFFPEEGNIFDTLSTRNNIVVIADEAHRTQYGFKPKNIDKKDPQGHIIDHKITYGFAKYMRDALPHAIYLGFTGTPIESIDINTRAVFGNYIDIYDISRAVKDGATVEIFYESRLAQVALTEEGRQLIKALDKELDGKELIKSQQAKAKWTRLEALLGHPKRIQLVAQDIISHFETRQEVFEGKAMVVAISRKVATKLYNTLITLRPSWHSDDLTKGTIKIVMTAASSDGPDMARYHTTKEQRTLLADRMKNPSDSLKIVIVCDMWLTGFDVPCLHTLYIDKPMKGHSLMQAIARVNRVYKDKQGGLIVDYVGIATDLKHAFAFYAKSGGKGHLTINQDQAVQRMLEKLEIVANMFLEQPAQQNSYTPLALASEPEGIYITKHRRPPYQNYFTGDTETKLNLLLKAQEHILSIEDGYKRFADEVTALSKAFSLAIPHEQALKNKEEIGFFQAVKSRLQKYDTNNTTPDHEMASAVKQVIDKAIAPGKVISIFDAAGIKKPNLSILSDEFLMDIKNMNHKHLAQATLRKLLCNEIKSRTKTNLVQSKSLMRMLEEAIKKYQNKLITATEIIEQLIDLAQNLTQQDRQDKALNLSKEELAFYYALAENKSAKQVLGDEGLKTITTALAKIIKKKATIDWTIREDARAKLRLAVKKTLRKFGYPPDAQKKAIETVVQQAEQLANHQTNNMNTSTYHQLYP